MKTKLVFLLIFLSFTVSVQPLSKNQITRIDSLFSRWDKTNSPGCILGIIKDGKFIYQQGYGLANLEHGIAISPNTVFDIGSISKQFTATAIILLQQQGKLSLDDNIQKYIPEFPNYVKPITIRHLLNHTSGLRDYLTLLNLSSMQEKGEITKKDALSIIIKQKALNFTPGESWDYSNTGFFLASVIVERISRQTMKAFAEQNIFGPLGMKNTFFLDNHSTIVPNRATGHAPNETVGFQINMSNWEVTGAGAVQTNCNDLFLWDQNFYKPKVGGQDLLQHLTTTGHLNNGVKINYSLGLFKDDFHGLELIHHGGAWVGYRCEMLRFPQEKFSVICLSNLATFEPSKLAREVAKIYLSDKLKDQPTEILPIELLDETLLNSYTGSYRTEFNDYLRKVTLENGKLYYVRNPTNKEELIYKGNDDFIMKESDLIVKFIRDNNHSVTAANLYRGEVFDTHFDRYTPSTFVKKELSGLSGNYFSEELNITWKLDIGDSTLQLKSLINEDLTSLTEITTNSFVDSSYGLSIDLIRDKNRQVVGFYMSMDRVRKIHFKKI